MDEQEVGIEQLIQALPIHERVPVLALKTHFDQRSALDIEQEAQLEQVRLKYAQKAKPLLDRASELIQGSIPKKEEVALLEQYLKAGEKIGVLKGKVIDNYWASALSNSSLESFMTEKDEQALQNLLNIESVAGDDDNCLAFKFVFKQNPYFQETTTIRRLKVENGKPSCIDGDVLTPKVGNWLTHEQKKVTNKGNGESKIIMGKKIDSFFDIFSNLTLIDNPKELVKCVEIFRELGGVVENSFDYFLGLFEQDLSEDMEDYDMEDESEENNKKKKK